MILSDTPLTHQAHATSQRAAGGAERPHSGAPGASGPAGPPAERTALVLRTPHTWPGALGWGPARAAGEQGLWRAPGHCAGAPGTRATAVSPGPSACASRGSQRMWPRPPSRQFSGFTVREELLGRHSRLIGVHRHPGCRQPHALQTWGLPCPAHPLGGRVSPCVNGPLAVAFCSALCFGSSLSPEIEGGLAAGRQRSRHERRLSSLHGRSGHPRPGRVLPSPPPAQLDSPGGPAESARKPGVWTCSGLREKRRPNLAAAPLQTLRTVNGARKAAARDRAAGAAGAGGLGGPGLTSIVRFCRW